MSGPAQPTPPPATPTEPPEPPTPPEPPEPPARHGLTGRWRAWWRLRRQATELRWAFLFRGVMRAGLVTQVLLLHIRYTCGHLAAGFLVSAPIQLIGGSYGQWDEGRIWKSMWLGGLFGLPFLLLMPFTNVDWGRMRIPEFKHLELAFSRWALWASLGLLVLALLIQAGHGSDSLLDLRVAWVNLVLMFFAWVRVKANMIMFREFYTLKPGDELVISLPLGYKRPHQDEGSTEPAPTEPAPTDPAPTGPAPPGAASPGDASAGGSPPASNPEIGPSH